MSPQKVLCCIALLASSFLYINAETDEEAFYEARDKAMEYLNSGCNGLYPYGPLHFYTTTLLTSAAHQLSRVSYESFLAQSPDVNENTPLRERIESIVQNFERLRQQALDAQEQLIWYHNDSLYIGWLSLLSHLGAPPEEGIDESRETLLNLLISIEVNTHGILRAPEYERIEVPLPEPLHAEIFHIN